MEKEKVSSFRERFGELLSEGKTPMSEVASSLGVSAKTVYSWKSGTRTPKPPAVATIAALFGVNPEWLEGYDAEKRVPEDQKQAHTIEARLISHGVDAMPPDKREKALAMFRLLFEQYANEFEGE